MKKTTIALSGALVLAGCGAGGDGADDGSEGPLSMGFIPSQDADELATTVEPLADRLSEELDREIDAQVMTDYSALVEGMRTQSIDIGFLDPLGFVQAEERADVEVILKSIRFGEDHYLAQFNVMADSDIDSFDDILEADEGELVWAYADVSSPAGYLFPASHMLDEGLEDVDDQFEHVIAGGNDNALQSLMDGQADFATTFDDARDNLEDEHPDIHDEVEVIEYTDPIPNDTISVRSELNDELVDEIRETFMSFNDDEEMLEVLDEIYNWTGIAEASSEDYDIVRDTYERFQEEIEE
ncbi:phosphate/phosphite/phosphonate ABC transporter substrate-binding protein [Salsuginibacillus halophilus]|nr:phosphate/phosphite/phosphonate ABC transporter substrate-binding protein [Salsuginibacillus halophilus]